MNSRSVNSVNKQSTIRIRIDYCRRPRETNQHFSVRPNVTSEIERHVLDRKYLNTRLVSFVFLCCFVCLFVFHENKKGKTRKKKKTGTQNSVHPVNPMRRKPQKTDEQTKRFNVLNARKSKSLKNEYPSKKKTNKQTMPTRGNENDPIICCVTLFPPKNLETISRLFIFV